MTREEAIQKALEDLKLMGEAGVTSTDWAEAVEEAIREFEASAPQRTAWRPIPDKATVAVLTTTVKGYERTAALVESASTAEASPIEDLLLAVDAEYFCIGEIELNFETSYMMFAQEYQRTFGAHTPTSAEDFKRAFEEDLIHVRLLQWDDTGQVKGAQPQ